MTELLDAVLVLYHHFSAKNAPTILEHVTSFERCSRYPVVTINTDDGFPPLLNDLAFKAIVLHYSLFAGPRYFINPRFQLYVEQATKSQVIAFFQDEYRYCPQRFDFIDRTRVDSVYTLLESPHAEDVYRNHTTAKTIRSTLTGYVSEDLVRLAARLFKPDQTRTVDVGYRARRLPAFMGRGAQEKHEIADRFIERAADLDLRLDIATGESSRIYGDEWYQFVSNCRGMLGVEAGTSVFDLDDTARTRTKQLLESEPALSFDELERRVLSEYEDKVPYRTVSPRHFEAAAFRVVQILYEGQYSGVLEPELHYLPLAKDWSNFDAVMEQFADPQRRAALTERAYQDLIASGRYAEETFIAKFDEHLADLGLAPDAIDPAELDRLRRTLRPRLVPRLLARSQFLDTRPFPGRRLASAAYRKLRRSSARIT